MSETKKYVIIDTDCGIDDALALILAFDCHQKGLIEILGITCVYGNVCVDKVVKNVFITQRVCGIQNIKVFKGCGSPLKDNKGFEDYFMGSDGLGDCTHTMPQIDFNQESEHAVHALIRLAKQYPKQITLITLGPLTNIAMATHFDSEFSNNLAHLISMGGLLEMLGNVGPTTEFNYFNDPESVHVVLANSQCPLTIVPWDTCFKSRMSWDIFDQIIGSGKERAIFIGKIYEMIANDKVFGRAETDGIILCDIVAVITGLFPQMVSISNEYPVAMELNGQLTRGTLVVEQTPRIETAFPTPFARKARFVVDLKLTKTIELINKMALN